MRLRAPRGIFLLLALAAATSLGSPALAQSDNAPVVTAPATASGAETLLLAFTDAAADPDGDAITNLTATPLPSGATFTKNASNTSGTFAWTPTQTGNFNVTFVASNTLTGSATTAIIIGPDERQPVVTAPATASGTVLTLITFPVSAADPDGDPILSFTASGSAITAGATFTVNASNTSGTFSWTPAFNQEGSYAVTFTAWNSLTATATTFITVTERTDRAPIVTAPTTASGMVGIPMSFTVSAVDLDGQAITSLTATGLPPGATFTTNVASTQGTFNWTPNLIGSFTVTFTAANALSGSKSTVLTIGPNETPRPVVTAPATASGNEGSLITFTVSASDPDGLPLVLTASGSAITAGAAFSANASGTSGTFSWTPTFSQSGSYSVTFTAANGNGGIDIATTNITVVNVPTGTIVSAPPSLTGPGCPLHFVVTASNSDGLSIVSLTGAPLPAGATFVVNAANTSGTFDWTPSFTQAGCYSITFTATDSNGGTGSATTTICITSVDRAPVVLAPSTASGPEGALLTFTATAVDPDGTPILSFAAPSLPPGATFTVNATNSSGTFAWTPTFTQAGSYTATFVACSALCPGETVCALSGTATVAITITNTSVCQTPVADAGGPYLGVLNGPIQFDGSLSSDAGGSPLTYEWDFGDGTTAVGVSPTHAYSTAGTFTVTLTVFNSCGLSDTDVTTATTQQFCALAFTTGGNKTLRLASGKSTWCAQVQPANDCYGNADVNLASIVLQYPGGTVSEIAALSDKTAVTGDRNGDGTEEITVCFGKEDLRLLFSGLPSGESTVTATLRMDLVTGGQVSAEVLIRVFSSGAALAARVTPNPFNPRATLSFRTTRAGFARARLYDSSGRLVRTLLDESSIAPGYHEVPLDGRGPSGQPLASGIYHFRVEAAEGTSGGRVVLLK